MKIIKWTKWNKEYPEFESAEEINCAEKEIIKELRNGNYHFNGYYHQNGEFGAPVFDNGKQYKATLRGWGAIMAKAYPEEVDDGDGYGYCVWAWNLHKDFTEKLTKYPNNKNLEG